MLLILSIINPTSESEPFLCQLSYEKISDVCCFQAELVFIYYRFNGLPSGHSPNVFISIKGSYYSNNNVYIPQAAPTLSNVYISLTRPSCSYCGGYVADDLAVQNQPRRHGDQDHGRRKSKGERMLGLISYPHLTARKHDHSF